MKTTKISEKLSTALNKQITNEAYISQIYLSYAAWADSNGYASIANFLFRHSAIERNQTLKFIEFILQRGAKVNVSVISAPKFVRASVNDCFEKVFKHEVRNTKAIYKLLKLSQSEGDWATKNFLQWFANEQTEEENFAFDLFDKIKITGGEKSANRRLYLLDKELGKTPNNARLALDATANNSQKMN
jgi:ferritin